MKKILFFVVAIMVFTNVSVLAADNVESENLILLAKKGFFDNSSKKSSACSPAEEIRRTFNQHYKYSNEHNFEGLYSMYSDDYTNEDGFNKKVYFDLVKKTWASYPDIRYKLDIKNIVINNNIAVVQVHEIASSTTPAKDGVGDKGSLDSISDTVYYLEKVGNKWLVTSDRIIYEKTYLRYGSAKYLGVNLIAPSQIQADKPYTVSLQVDPNTDAFVIASIGQEFITYPQVAAKEVFRKLPKDGVLERMFTSNNKNLNEYAVASYGITKAEVKAGKEINISVTGLGFVMQRVDVIPKNNFVKVKDEKVKENQKAK